MCAPANRTKQYTVYMYMQLQTVVERSRQEDDNSRPSSYCSKQAKYLR